MKLLRYGAAGEELPGMIDEQGHIRDLSNYVADFNPRTLANLDLINHLKTLNPYHLPLVSKDIRIGACIGMPGKVVCVGYNSRLHNQQMGVSPISETEMIVFMKPTSAVCGAYDPILYTRHTKKLDWEAELGVIIGKKGKYITKDQAKNYIFGYACINDLSDRYAAPIGPYLVTRDEIQDSSNLQIKLWVNGEIRQDFNTSDYIHNDEEVVSYLSQYFTLYPGDIISMGSAPGNARSWGENMFLKPNDKVLLSIIGLGQQEKVVIVEDVF